jgi:hypothetical protein
MAYKITRNVVHTTGHNTKKFTDWVEQDISFMNDIQPLYPALTENNYYNIINERNSLVDPLSVWENLFLGSPGFISYTYNYDGIPQYFGVTSITQEFLFNDQESYAAWQVQENALGDIRLSNWALSLEEKYIDYANVRTEGKQLINLDNGTTSDMSVIKYLTTKYYILRETQLSVIHSIVE